MLAVQNGDGVNALVRQNLKKKERKEMKMKKQILNKYKYKIQI